MGINGNELEYAEEENILYYAVLRIRDGYPGSCFFTHPGFWILDLETSTKERKGVKKIYCHTFLCSHKFIKLKIILFLKC
jgi:hypothetical protein